MAPRLAGLTKLTLETAPTVCHDCIWWQTRGRRSPDKDRWMEKVELDFGALGTVYYDSDGRVLGSMQYGPAQAFPRAAELPGGPPSDDAMLVTCAYLVDRRRARGCCSRSSSRRSARRATAARASLEAFSYRYPEGESAYERFRVHDGVSRRTSSPTSASRSSAPPGASGCRGSSSAACSRSQEGRREKVLRVVKDAFGVPERCSPLPAVSPRSAREHCR